MRAGKFVFIHLCLSIFIINCVSTAPNLAFFIAKTIYNQARGEGQAGMDLVASTIVNRRKLNRYYLGGDDLMQIISRGYNGFSMENPDKNQMSEEDINAWQYCKNLASQIDAREFQDNAGGATHFHQRRNGFANIEGRNLIYLFKYGHYYFFQEK